MKMNLKTSLRNTVMAVAALTVALPAYAIWTGPICWITFACVPWDLVEFAARLWGIAAEKKLLTTEISATEGLQPILDNIGKGKRLSVALIKILFAVLIILILTGIVVEQQQG